MTDVQDRTPVGAQTVRLELPAQPGYIVLARLALSAVCRLTPLGDEDVADLKLAITEAATAFVGEIDEDEPVRGLEPVPDPAATEETLRFSFELRDTDLVVEVACDRDIDIAEEELELSRAIINATVDDCQSRPGSITLVKHLAVAAE
jgi:hypothetical protein